MASQLPVWCMGWDVGPVTIRFQVADASGVLGNGSPASSARALTGVIDAIEVISEDLEEEISPLTSRLENSVAIATNDRIRLVEICSNNITGGNWLSEAFNNGQAGGEYAIAAFTRSGNSVTFTGTMGELREDVRMGKSVMTLEMGIADVYDNTPNPDVPAANPVYA